MDRPCQNPSRARRRRAIVPDRPAHADSQLESPGGILAAGNEPQRRTPGKVHPGHATATRAQVRASQSAAPGSALHSGQYSKLRGVYSEAAQHFEVANALKVAVKAANGQSFDPDQYSRSIDRIIATFDPELFARIRGWCDPDPRPVFVVGLPRSGTTLVEQILASHSQVHGAGELRDVMGLFGSLPDVVGRPEIDAFEAMNLLDPETARTAARTYLARLDQLAPAKTRRIVDKMPDNFLMLGLIAVLWPGARVIICNRDLRDVALSCWQTPFITNPWTNQWGHIARRLADHERLLAHWKLARPIEWLDVTYEELVHDLEGNARRMIEFLTLQWEPGCLEFHKNTRVVRTASHLQVREPIHFASVGRWRKYECVLGPLFDALKRYGVELDERPENSSGPRSGNQLPVQADISVDDGAQGEFFIDPSAGGRA